MAITIVETGRRDGVRQLSVSQSAAGAADVVLAAPPTGYAHTIVGFFGTMTADGTVQFLSAATVLNGALNVAANGAIGWRGSQRFPFLECATAEALNLTTTGGAFRGVVFVKTSPKA